MRTKTAKKPDARKIRGARVEAFERRLLLSTYLVNTLSDSANPGAGLLTFRAAVADANAHAGADVIAFVPEVFTPDVLHTIQLVHGQISFTDTTGATTVVGPGPSVLAVDGGGKSRVLGIAVNANVSISALTISGGKQTIADSNASTFGGGIDNAGTLTLSNCTLSGNAVEASASANVNGQVTAGTGVGGAIYSSGALTITTSSIFNNSVNNTAPLRSIAGLSVDSGAAYGGAVYCLGTLFLDEDNISGNSAAGSNGQDATVAVRGGAAVGGGVYASANATILGTTMNSNTATGGSAAAHGASDGGNASGGGLFVAGSLSMSTSTLQNNVLAAGQSSLDGGHSGSVRGGAVYAASSVVITTSNLDFNSALAGNTGFAIETSAGGSVFAAAGATLTADDISGNDLTGGPGDPSGSTTTAGGGVYSGGQLTILNTSILGNSVGGQIFKEISEVRAGGQNIGGGIVTTAPSTITSSTIGRNEVFGGAGTSASSNSFVSAAGDALGGGIYSTSSLTITNTTLVNNSVQGGGGRDGDLDHPAGNGGSARGGGVYTSGEFKSFDSTISGNTATGGDGGQMALTTGSIGAAVGGGIDVVGGTIVLSNTIASSNIAGGVFNDIVGSVSSLSASNLVGFGGGLTNGIKGNKVGFTNPMLSELGDNGGPTFTAVPLPGSPAIDGGNNSLIPSGITKDQRGVSRISGKAVDIGAVETGDSSISGTVFNDANHDGVQDNGEKGIAGIEVYNDTSATTNLFGANVAVFTDSNGRYLLPLLQPGNYEIREYLPGGSTQTTPANDFGWTITLGARQSITGKNFGELSSVPPPSLISGTVFHDSNANGILDAGDFGLAEITVYNDANNNGRLDSGEMETFTDADGNYRFVGLPAGHYKIRAIFSPTSVQTTPRNGFGWTLTLAATQSLTGKNFGEESASISGTVFNDANGNQTQDANEPGFNDFTVYIDTNNDGALDFNEVSVRTNADGVYAFTGLAAGSYTVRISVYSDWLQTSPSNNFGRHVTVAANHAQTGQNFGIKQIA